MQNREPTDSRLKSVLQGRGGRGTYSSRYVSHSMYLFTYKMIFDMYNVVVKVHRLLWYHDTQQLCFCCSLDCHVYLIFAGK